jgi:predicted metal-dependent peptidase
VLRRIFGPKAEKLTGDLRKKHVEALHSEYFSQNIIAVDKSGSRRKLNMWHAWER